MSETPRPPSAAELRLLRTILAVELEGSRELSEQLDGLLVSRDSPAFTDLIVDESRHGPAPMTDGPDAIGQYRDTDGLWVIAEVRVIDGYMRYLEIYKIDSSEVLVSLDDVDRFYAQRSDSPSLNLVDEGDA